MTNQGDAGDRLPTVYIVAGPNGAGKTTFSMHYLPRFVDCREFLNADLIAAGLSPFAPERQNVKAGRLLLERFKELARDRRNFGFETTLSGRTYTKLLRDLKADGYQIFLHFLWLPSAEMAITRVANRVRHGGHNVPVDDIKRRYSIGLRNLFQLYRPLLDGWWLYDASQFPPNIVYSLDCGKVTVIQEALYLAIKQQSELQHE